MKHLKRSIERTKGLPFACISACILGGVVKKVFPDLQGIGDTLALILILLMLIAILDLIFAYMRDIVND